MLPARINGKDLKIYLGSSLKLALGYLRQIIPSYSFNADRCASPAKKMCKSAKTTAI